MGAEEPAQRHCRRTDRDGDDGLGRRPRAVAAPREDRDRDLAPEDDRVQLLHDGARRDDGPQGRSLPPRLPLRPVLSDRLRPRTRCRPRLQALADPGQGLLREQGRARLQPARQFRPPRLRIPCRLADGHERGDRTDLPPRADRLARRARLRRVRRDRAGPQRRRQARQGLGVRDRVLLRPPARRLAARLAPQRRRPRAARARRRGRGAARRCSAAATRATSRPPSGSPRRPSGRPSAGAARTARTRP